MSFLFTEGDSVSCFLYPTTPTNPRLQPLIYRLQNLLKVFNAVFTFQLFMFGFKCVRNNRLWCQLINFLLVQAKMAIYPSRKKQSTEYRV